MGEVAVGGVDFGEEEAGGGGAVGGGGEVGEDFVHVGAVDSRGEWCRSRRRCGGGADGLPAAFWQGVSGSDRGRCSLTQGGGHAGFAAGVGELDGGDGAVFLDELR